MPGRMDFTFEGLVIRANIIGERGLYFTDEIIRAEFEVYNSTTNKITGMLPFFYGFGPVGTEGRSPMPMKIDVLPGNTQCEYSDEKLIGIQGNNIIGLYLPPEGVNPIQEKPDGEKIISYPFTKVEYRTLYTFVSMEKQFYEAIHARPAKMVEQGNDLQRTIMFLTIAIAILTFINMLIYAPKIFAWFKSLFNIVI